MRSCSDRTRLPSQASRSIAATDRRTDHHEVFRAAGRGRVSGSRDRETDRFGSGAGRDRDRSHQPVFNGTRFEDRLSEYGIEATLEGETPAPATAIGRAVLDLLRASSPGGTAAQLISFLRGPIAIDASAVDRLERSVLCEGIDSATDAAGLLGDDASRLPGWPDLTSGETDPTTAVETAVNSMLDVILSRNRSPGNEPRIRTESRIATAITRACRDLDEILGRPARSDEIARAIDGGSVKTWSLPNPENVVIASPYRMRAKRFSYLFMVSLQERGMDDPEQAGPFLSAASRSAVGMPPPKGCRGSGALPVLFMPQRADPGAVALLQGRRRIRRDRVPLPLHRRGAAPSRPVRSARPTGRPLRIRGVLPGRRRPQRKRIGALPRRYGSRNLRRSRTRKRGWCSDRRTHRRGDCGRRADAHDELLGTPAARTVVAGLDSFGPTTLEAFTECPYRWFVEKQLRPSRFGPTPPAMARGILIHDVLERLHSESEPRMPDTDSIETWKDEAGELVDSRAEEHGLGGDSAEQACCAHRRGWTYSASSSSRLPGSTRKRTTRSPTGSDPPTSSSVSVGRATTEFSVSTAGDSPLSSTGSTSSTARPSSSTTSPAAAAAYSPART